jgi:tetratricopeptide (TPR) repeat protein
MRLGRFVLGYGLVLPTLFSIACSSRQSAKEQQPVSSSSQQDKASSPSPSQPAAQADKKRQDESNISYAKNPERFAKVPAYEPPFNIADPKTAQEHFNVAVNYDHHNELDKAIAEYQKALETQPNWAVAHDRLALDYQKQGRTDDAISEWEQATRYNPQFYSAYDLLAGAYERQGKIKKAIEAYSALLKYPPAQMPAHYQLGLWYAQIGDRQQAQSHLESYRDLALKTREEPKSDRFQKALRELLKLKQQG